MKKNKIHVINGLASFSDKNTVNIKSSKKNITIKAEKIIILTGSKPIVLPFFNFDKKRIITSTEALSLKEVPKRWL